MKAMADDWFLGYFCSWGDWGLSLYKRKWVLFYKSKKEDSECDDDNM